MIKKGSMVEDSAKKKMNCSWDLEKIGNCNVTAVVNTFFKKILFSFYAPLSDF